MRAALLFLLIASSAASIFGQAAASVQDPPDLLVIKCSFATKYTLDPREDDLTYWEPQKGQEQRERRVSWEKRPVYSYRALVKNTGTKVIKAIDWTYVFEFDVKGALTVFATDNLSCERKIRPGESKEIDQGKKPADRPGTISVEKNGKQVLLQPVREYVRIRRIRYADGSVWEAY